MSVTIYIPGDSGALALGADKVAKAIEKEIAARGIDAKIVRNGSRGAYFLEPMVEVATDAGRVAYGPVIGQGRAVAVRCRPRRPAARIALSLGDPEKIPFLAKQTRLTFARCGITDPVSLDDYKAHDGLTGLANAVAMAPADIVKQVTDSGLRGRGGAGFPTGIKWKTVLDTTADQKYIVCNADEGDSGTFADRMIMEGDPFVLIEGMAIAGIAVGATKGYIYIRSEYPHAAATMNEAVRDRAAGRRAGQQRARLGACLRHGGARRRRRLCLRRGDLAARIAGRQARPGPRQAAAAGAQGPVRQADGHQQRDLAGLGAGHHGSGRGLLQGFRHGPLARHDPDPDRRQRQEWRAVRGGVRADARRDRRRHRRRHGDRPAGQGRAGRRAARRLFPARAVRHAVRLRGLRRQGRADRPCRHRGVRRHAPTC